jgi:hypothetical protein
VSHFERQHGRSQFFRVRSLFSTFLQIVLVYWRLVVKPAWHGSSRRTAGTAQEPPPSRQHAALVVLAVCVLSLLAYGRALSLPFISDDYVHIQVARDYGPVSKWGNLAQDALYRCRATSTWLAYLLDRTVGMDPVWFRVSSLFFHIANGLLLFALGAWKRIGWRTAAIAACFFAISQRHSEAVIWFAAIPELLVFFFLALAFLCWVLWLQAERSRPLYYVAAYAAFLLALLSKESAVALVPLCAMATLFQPGRKLQHLLALIPFALTAGGYFALDWMAQDTNLFFSDGTFSLHAPVLEVVFRSTTGLLWFWGAVALIFAATVRLAPAIIPVSIGWTIIGLLPYSFLTYMPRVPSRHTYLASAGVAWLVAGAFIAFRKHKVVQNRRWLVPALAVVIVAHQCGYLWLVIHRRYVLRAEPTETLLKIAQHQPEEIYASCFPYSPVVADYALMTVFPAGARPRFRFGPHDAKNPLAQDFCNQLAEGKRP